MCKGNEGLKESRRKKEGGENEKQGLPQSESSY